MGTVCLILWERTAAVCVLAPRRNQLFQLAWPKLSESVYVLGKEYHYANDFHNISQLIQYLGFVSTQSGEGKKKVSGDVEKTLIARGRETLVQEGLRTIRATFVMSEIFHTKKHFKILF